MKKIFFVALVFSFTGFASASCLDISGTFESDEDEVAKYGLKIDQDHCSTASFALVTQVKDTGEITLSPPLIRIADGADHPNDGVLEYTYSYTMTPTQHLMKITLKSGESREWVYSLDFQKNLVQEFIDENGEPKKLTFPRVSLPPQSVAYKKSRAPYLL